MQTLIPAKVVSENVIPALELVEPIKVPDVNVLCWPWLCAPLHCLLHHFLQGTQVLLVPCLAPQVF